MYIIKNDYRNQVKTYDGWTHKENGILIGLENALKFTQREAELNKDKLPKGCRFIKLPSGALNAKQN